MEERFGDQTNMATSPTWVGTSRIWNKNFFGAEQIFGFYRPTALNMYYVN